MEQKEELTQQLVKLSQQNEFLYIQYENEQQIKRQMKEELLQN